MITVGEITQTLPEHFTHGEDARNDCSKGMQATILQTQLPDLGQVSFCGEEQILQALMTLVHGHERTPGMLAQCQESRSDRNEQPILTVRFVQAQASKNIAQQAIFIPFVEHRALEVNLPAACKRLYSCLQYIALARPQRLKLIVWEDETLQNHDIASELINSAHFKEIVVVNVSKNSNLLGSVNKSLYFPTISKQTLEQIEFLSIDNVLEFKGLECSLRAVLYNTLTCEDKRFLQLLQNILEVQQKILSLFVKVQCLEQAMSVFSAQGVYQNKFREILFKVRDFDNTVESDGLLSDFIRSQKWLKTLILKGKFKYLIRTIEAVQQHSQVGDSSSMQQLDFSVECESIPQDFPEVIQKIICLKGFELKLCASTLCLQRSLYEAELQPVTMRAKALQTLLQEHLALVCDMLRYACKALEGHFELVIDAPLFLAVLNHLELHTQPVQIDHISVVNVDLSQLEQAPYFDRPLSQRQLTAQTAEFYSQDSAQEHLPLVRLQKRYAALYANLQQTTGVRSDLKVLFFFERVLRSECLTLTYVYTLLNRNSSSVLSTENFPMYIAPLHPAPWRRRNLETLSVDTFVQRIQSNFAYLPYLKKFQCSQTRSLTLCDKLLLDQREIFLLFFEAVSKQLTERVKTKNLRREVLWEVYQECFLGNAEDQQSASNQLSSQQYNTFQPTVAKCVLPNFQAERNKYYSRFQV